ncbi:unnamed protein product [Callosobruchus maculatus]|uniref:Uncharacterized protein n=1 Tax=Callosobruchus maculatus TaxID=64391 RepID=A0A653CD42_CALMS|nr:unnamed protein product [Callosobruchus maculatus]
MDYCEEYFQGSEATLVPAPIPQHAATASMLNTADPTIVPTPISPSVIKVPMTFTKSSGADVAAAMKVAPATSDDIFNAVTNVDFEDILMSFTTKYPEPFTILLITADLLKHFTTLFLSALGFLSFSVPGNISSICSSLSFSLSLISSSGHIPLHSPLIYLSILLIKGKLLQSTKQGQPIK